MDISFTALSVVAHDAEPRAPHLEQDIEANVQAFFRDHIEALRAMSDDADAPPPGLVVEPECQDLFQRLQAGDINEFADTAGVFAKRLIKYMNGSTAKGLLACVRAEDNGDRLTAALKLEIDASNGTRLEELAAGEIRLAAVTNVLQQPGKLQKGILVHSGMPAEEVLCGDVHATQAQYFPRAFGIRTFARPSQGPPALLKIIAQRDVALAVQVAAVLPQVRSGTLPEVLSELGDRVSSLDAAIQAELIETLEQSPRPIARIDTSKQVITVIGDGDIVLRGPAEEIGQRVDLHETADGWEAHVRFGGTPKTTFR